MSIVWSAEGSGIYPSTSARRSMKWSGVRSRRSSGPR